MDDFAYPSSYPMYIDKEFSAPRHLSVSSTSLSEATMIVVNTIAYFVVRLGEKLDERLGCRYIPLLFLNPSVKGWKLCMEELRLLGEPKFMFTSQRFTCSTATQPNTSLNRFPFSSKNFPLHYHGFDAHQQNPKRHQPEDGRLTTLPSTSLTFEL